jgi:hypothetical protein
MASKGSNNASSYSSYTRYLGSEMASRMPTIHFTNVDDIQAALYSFVSQNLDAWIKVTHLPYSRFRELISEDTGLYHLKLTYFRKEELGLFKMASAPHQTIASHIIVGLSTKMISAGLKDDISIRSAVKSDLGNAEKASDGALGPRHGTYATFVIEVAFSETGPHLVASSHLWLEAEGSHVKQVLAVNIDQKKAHIRFEIWEHRRQGRVPRGASEAPVRGYRTEEVLAILDDDKRPQVIGTLAISFTKLLEREPVPEKGEPPFFILTAADIEDVAVRVWEDQGFLPRP